jgi:hypothetical protein
MTLSPEKVPYTGPYAQADNPRDYRSKGPTVEALKRALSRMGAPSLPWREFDQHYNADLEKAFDWFDPGGQNGYGDGRWKLIRGAIVPPGRTHTGDYALDEYGQKLIQDEADAAAQPGPPEPKPSDAFFEAFVKFANDAIGNEAAWHYDQDRPVALNVNPKAGNVWSDCSGFGIQAADYARRKASRMDDAQDPAKQSWSGYGNTDLYEDDWPKISAPFRVGDAMHFANPRHVIWCIQKGDVHSSVWVSHGQEGGPDRVDLDSYSRYPGDYMFAVRPKYLPD